MCYTCSVDFLDESLLSREKPVFEQVTPEQLSLVKNTHRGGSEARIAENIEAACIALGIQIAPEQARTLAKHTLVGHVDAYNSGIPLTDTERTIALRLETIKLRAYVEEDGSVFTSEHLADCERSVRFGERGLHIGHKIGDVVGCGSMFAILFVSLAGVIYLFA